MAPGSRRVCVPPARGVDCFQLKLGGNLKEARRLPAGVSTKMGRGGEGRGCHRVNHGELQGYKSRNGMVEAGGGTLPHGLGKNTSIPKMLDISFCRGGRLHVVPPTGCPILLLHQQHDANGTRLADMAQDILNPEIKGVWESSAIATTWSWPHITPLACKRYARNRGGVNASDGSRTQIRQVEDGSRALGPQQVVSASSCSFGG